MICWRNLLTSQSHIIFLYRHVKSAMLRLGQLLSDLAANAALEEWVQYDVSVLVIPRGQLSPLSTFIVDTTGPMLITPTVDSVRRKQLLVCSSLH